MGKANGRSLDRIDNDGGYTPKNCRWVYFKTQNRNKNNNILITYKNKTKCVAQWAEELELNYQTLYNRIIRNWSIDRAFNKQLGG